MRVALYKKCDECSSYKDYAAEHIYKSTKTRPPAFHEEHGTEHPLEKIVELESDRDYDSRMLSIFIKRVLKEKIKWENVHYLMGLSGDDARLPLGFTEAIKIQKNSPVVAEICPLVIKHEEVEIKKMKKAMENFEHLL